MPVTRDMAVHLFNLAYCSHAEIASPTLREAESQARVSKINDQPPKSTRRRA